MPSKDQNAIVLQDTDDYIKIISDWKKQKCPIVFTNGCFDILHAGHVMYLKEAANLGEKLVIGLNDDASVRQLKGSNRPINQVHDRAAILSALYMVDMIIIFSGETPLQLIDKIDPDYLVKGGDYKINEVVGSELVLAKGKKVMVMSQKIGYSTSKIIEAL